MNDQTTPRLQCHTITLKSSSSTDAVIADIQDIIALAALVFSPYNSNNANFLDDRHLRQDVWLERLQLPHAQLIYTAQPSADNSKATPLGFFFSAPRTHPEIGYETFHVWLAAVRAEARGSGVFPLLMEETRKHAKQAGFEELSICTYPALFTKMYSVLTKNGWDVMGWRKEEDGDKVVMRLKI